MSIDVNVQNDLVIVTESSEDIVVNVSNAAGPAGANGVGVPVGGATGQVLKKFTNTDYDTYWAADASGLTSVGLSMPTAFTVSNTPLTSNGTISVTGAGTAAQYVRGDGQLATFPGTASGGSSVNYYLNGSVNASVAGYKQLANTATIGGGTDFTLVGNGLIAQFLTDVGNPNRVEIPGGAWNFEIYFQVSSAGGNQKFYVELLKYDGVTFTSIASSISVPEEITGGTSIDLYLTSLAVPTTALLVTDRLAIRVYIVDNAVGRTVTLHTEDNTLCEIITTFSGGIAALNGLSANTQYLATGTSGTDFNISSLTDTHTFNLPTASASNRGALSSADWSTFNSKVPSTRTLTINGTAYDLSADRSWTVSASATPAGSNTQIQYNNSGVFGASAGLVYNDSTGVMTLNKNLNIGTINQSTTYGLSNYLFIGYGHISSSNDTSPDFSLSQNVYYNGTNSIYTRSGFSNTFYLSNLGNFQFFTSPSGVANATATLTERMRLTNAGRLLLGTTTESTFLLDVNGTARVSGRITSTVTNDSALVIQSSGFLTLGESGQNIMSASAALLIGGGTTGLGIRFTIGVVFGTGSAAFHYLKDGYALFSTQSSAVDLSSGIPASAVLEARSTTKGFLPPRMTNAQRVAISSPAVGLIVYCTDATEGLYQYINNAWVNLTGIVTNRQTASYTLALGDSNDLVEMNVATANNLTVPLNSSVAFPIGTKIDISQYGAGQTTVVATGGVTVRSAGGALKLALQYSGASLVKIGTDEWYLFGDITV